MKPYLKLKSGRAGGTFYRASEWTMKEVTRKAGGRTYCEFECNTCGYLHEARKDCTPTRCPSCEDIAEKKYFSTNTKQCITCKVKLPLTSFSSHSMAADGLRDSCTSCRCSTWSKNNSLNRKHINKLASKLRAANRGRYNSYSAKRRALKLSATPKWLDTWDLKYIMEMYRMSSWLSSLGATKYEVDHIIPLQGNNVCGLHCPLNLQILSRADNRMKSNSVGIS